MKNINRLLQNSVRNELIGQNMYVFGKMERKYPWDFSGKGRLHPAHIWEEPSFAMKGILGLGHPTTGKDAIRMEVYKEGKELKFDVVRNVWTPAYMDTFYRCKPTANYPYSGLIVIRERKCIIKGDVFVSEITVVNGDNEEIELEFRIVTSFQPFGKDCYFVNLKTSASGLLTDFQ